MIEIQTETGTAYYNYNVGLITDAITTLPSIRIAVTSPETYDDLRLTAVLSNHSFGASGANDEGAEAMDEQWVQAKLPGGSWTPIGGSPAVAGKYLVIPKPATYTIVELRIVVPVGAVTIGDFSFAVELYYKIG